jgi:hypothetical protein
MTVTEQEINETSDPDAAVRPKCGYDPETASQGDGL